MRIRLTAAARPQIGPSQTIEEHRLADIDAALNIAFAMGKYAHGLTPRGNERLQLVFGIVDAVPAHALIEYR